MASYDLPHRTSWMLTEWPSFRTTPCPWWPHKWPASAPTGRWRRSDRRHQSESRDLRLGLQGACRNVCLPGTPWWILVAKGRKVDDRYKQRWYAMPIKLDTYTEKISSYNRKDHYLRFQCIWYVLYKLALAIQGLVAWHFNTFNGKFAASIRFHGSSTPQPIKIIRIQWKFIVFIAKIIIDSKLVCSNFAMGPRDIQFIICSKCR